MRNQSVSYMHLMHIFHLELYQVRGVTLWLALSYVPKEPGENPGRHGGETLFRSSLLSLQGNLRRAIKCGTVA